MLKSAIYRSLHIVVIAAALASVGSARHLAAETQDTTSLPTAATEFVHMILSRAGSPSAVAVTIQNLSSLAPETQEAIQNAIFNGFRSANVKVVKPEQTVPDVHITFSEDWQGDVWIARFKRVPAARW